jgi:TctA family transporter
LFKGHAAIYLGLCHKTIATVATLHPHIGRDAEARHFGGTAIFSGFPLVMQYFGYFGQALTLAAEHKQREEQEQVSHLTKLAFRGNKLYSCSENLCTLLF